MAYVENIPIVLPALSKKALEPSTLEEGPLDFPLGSFWSCNQNKPSPIIDNFEKDDLSNTDKFPIRTLSYDLRYVRESKQKSTTVGVGFSASAVIFFLEVNVASGNYSSTHISKLDSEELQVHYYREDQVHRLLPTDQVKSILRERLSDLSQEGAKPTHVVTEITYGAHLVADILIKTTSFEKLKNKTTSGLGNLIMGPLSAGIEAGLGAVLNSPPAGVEVKIEIESSHHMNPVTKIGEMFDQIKELDNNKGERKALKVFMVPISLFLKEKNGEAEPVYPLIGEHYMEAFEDMLLVLNDFKLEGYFRKRFTHADYRLRIFVEVEAIQNNPLGKDIFNAEDKRLKSAQDLFKKAKDFMENLRNYPKKQPDAETEIETLLENYETTFDLKAINSELDEFIRQGKEQLALVCADDIGDESNAKFYAVSNNALTKDTELSVIFNTKQSILGSGPNTDEEPTRGVFLAAYNLSKKINVSIYMPNSSEDFSIIINEPGESDSPKKFSGEEILPALEFLSVAAGVRDGCGARWYQTLASLNDQPIAFPIQEKDKILPMLDSLLREWKDIKIFETFMSLRAHIVNPLLKDELMFCLPIQACLSSLEGLKGVQKIRNLTENSYQWLVGDFDLIGDDAPLLVIFLAGKLQAVCLDSLDLLLLIDLFDKSSGFGFDFDFSSLHLNSHFHPYRSKFAFELKRLFRFDLDEQIEIINTSILIEGVDEAKHKKLQNALEVCKAYLAIEKREMQMITAIVRMATKEFKYLIPPLAEFGWSNYQQTFNNDIFSDNSKRQNFLDMLTSQLIQTQDFNQIGSFLYTIDFSIQTFESAPEEDGPFDVLNKIKVENIKLISKFEPEIAVKLTELLGSNETPELLKKYKEAADLIRTIVLISDKLPLKQKAEQYLQDLIKLVPEPLPEEKPKEDEPDTPPLEEQQIYSNVLDEIVKRYVKLVIPTQEVKEIDTWLEKRLIPKVCNELNNYQYPKWLREVIKSLNELNSPSDLDNLSMVFCTITELQIEESQKYFIWMNVHFCNFVRDGLINNPTFLKSVVDHVCPEDIVPLFVPSDIAKILTRFLETKEGDSDHVDPSRPTVWDSIENSLLALQGIVASLGNISTDLLRVLRRNLNSNPTLKKQFEEANALFYWNNSMGQFDETWEIQTILQAIENIRKWIQKQEDCSISLEPFLLEKPNENQDSEDQLIEIARSEFPQRVKKNLCQIQRWRRFSGNQWNDLWSRDELYKKLITLFCSIFKFKSSIDLNLETILRKLEQQLNSICQGECEYLIKKLFELHLNLREHLNDPNSKEDVVSNLVQEIRQVQSKIKSRNLQIKHFNWELMGIHYLFERNESPLKRQVLSTQSSNSNQILDFLCNQFKLGANTEIFNCFQDSLNYSLLKSISSSPEGEMKVFVINFVGDLFKSWLKEDLFGRSGRDPSVSLNLSQHGNIILWHISPELKSMLGANKDLDALILIENDDLFLPPGNDSNKEIKMSALTIASSDLTILYSNTSKWREEMGNHIDLSLIESFKIKESLNDVDLLVIHPDDKDSQIVIDHFKKFEEQFTPIKFELGAQPQNPCQLIRSRIEDRTISQSINQTYTDQGTNFDKTQINELLRVIASSFEDKQPRTVRKWIQDFTLNWENSEILVQAIPSSNSLEELINRATKTYKDFERIKEGLEIVISKHSKDSFEYLKLSFDEVIKSGMNQITEYLQNILEKCSGSITSISNGSPCSPCKALLSAWTQFTNINKEQSFKEEFETYNQQLSQIQWSRIHRLYLSMEIKACSGITSEFDVIFQEFNLNEATNEIEFINSILEELPKAYSDINYVLSPLRLFLVDLSIAYPQAPLLIRDFNKNRTMVEFPISLAHLSNGLELRLKLQDISQSIIAQVDESLGGSYQFGMIRQSRERVEIVLADYSNKYDVSIDQKTRWASHLYSSRILFNLIIKNAENGKDSQPGVLIKGFGKEITEEIKKRLQNVSAQDRMFLKYQKPQRHLSVPFSRGTLGLLKNKNINK